MRVGQASIQERKIDALAARYRELGYQVLVEPQGSDLPRFLLGYRPDLIARSADEAIVVEVKRDRAPEGDAELETLARLVSHEPGWHLRVVYLDLEDPEWQPPTHLPSTELLKRKLAETAVSPDQDRGAALLLLWSIVEGAARSRLAERGFEPTSRVSSLALVKQLLSEGWIDAGMYDRLVQILSKRNAVAHGFVEEKIDERMIGELRSLAEHLLEPKADTL